MTVATVFIDLNRHLTNALVWHFHCQCFWLRTILGMAFKASHRLDTVIIVWVIKISAVTSQASKSKFAVYRIVILMPIESQGNRTTVFCDTCEVSIAVAHYNQMWNGWNLAIQFLVFGLV